MKALFSGAMKKPLMTKVSMRHLNEIVRERNQYSRDALEAWQDFINLKGRMDTELTKVSKRNNFLSEELESWKQQVTQSPFASTTDAYSFYSFLNFKRSPSSLPRRLRISRSRSRVTSAKIVVSLAFSTSTKTMPHVSPPAYPALRSNATMHSRLLFSNRRSLRSLSGRESGTLKNYLRYST